MANVYENYMSTFDSSEDANGSIGRSIWAELKNVRYHHKSLQLTKAIGTSPSALSIGRRSSYATSTSSTPMPSQCELR